MHWILKIIYIEGFSITVLWNDGVVRTIDLEDFVFQRANNGNPAYKQLTDLNIFNQAKCDETTLYWENLGSYKDYDGNFVICPLDIDPEVLYSLVNESELV